MTDKVTDYVKHWTGVNDLSHTHKTLLRKTAFLQTEKPFLLSLCFQISKHRQGFIGRKLHLSNVVNVFHQGIAAFKTAWWQSIALYQIHHPFITTRHHVIIKNIFKKISSESKTDGRKQWITQDKTLHRTQHYLTSTGKAQTLLGLEALFPSGATHTKNVCCYGNANLPGGGCCYDSSIFFRTCLVILRTFVDLKTTVSCPSLLRLED